MGLWQVLSGLFEKLILASVTAARLISFAMDIRRQLGLLV